MFVGGGTLANKRIQKKQEKKKLSQKKQTNKRQARKKLQQKVVAQKVARGVPQEQAKQEVKTLTYDSLYNITQKEDKRKKRSKAKDDLRQRKKRQLEERGINPYDFTLTKIDSIKIKDFENGNFNRKNYPKFFEGIFDFDKIYVLKNGERMYFAFRDFAGEKSLDEILAEYEGKNPQVLLDRLKYLASLVPAYTKKRRGSRLDDESGRGTNGAGGDYKYTCAKQNVITDQGKDTYQENNRLRKKPKRKEHGKQIYRGFQTLKPNGFNNSTNVVTPRRLLEVMCAFMSNITEWDRVTFYKRIYTDIKKHMPDFADLLPEPLNIK